MKDAWIPLISSIKGLFTSVYIPGHCGISFNVRADELAGNAVPVADLLLTPSDVISRVRETLTYEEINQQQERWVTQRLMERGWKYGDAARSRIRGKDRRLSNQHELGVVSKYTLQAILEGGGPEVVPVPTL